jgi:hypothetical protein
MIKTPSELPQVDAEVIRDLLRAVDALAHDPDHLPLFQHCLYWLWLAAADRDGRGEPEIPSRLSEDDLARAVGPSNNERGKDRLQFLLTDCLDYRAGMVFEGLSPENQEHARKLFSALAIKDPQQRYKRTPLRLSRLGEIGLDRRDYETVRDAINRAHPYLRETANDEVDIYHEALIRKWRKFRGWVDEEYDRADLYRKVAIRLAKWRQEPNDPENWLFEKFAIAAKDTRLHEDLPPLELERLYAWEDDPLGIKSTPEKLPDEHIAMRRFIRDSVEYHKNVHEADAIRERQLKFRRRGMIGAAAVTLLLGFAYYLSYLLGEQELRALYASHIAEITTHAIDPTDDSVRRLAQLWQGLVAKELFDQPAGRVATVLAPFEIVIDPLGRRRDRLASTRAFGEATLSEALREVLAAPVPQAPPAPQASSSRSTTPTRVQTVATQPAIGKGPVLKESADGAECVDRTDPSKSLLSIKDNVVKTADGTPVLSFPPNFQIKLDPRCEVIVAASRQSNDPRQSKDLWSWSLQLNFITWRGFRRGWTSGKPDVNRNIPNAVKGGQLTIKEVRIEDDTKVVISVEAGNKGEEIREEIRVASLRSEPWPKWGSSGIGNAVDAASREDADKFCKGLSDKPAVTHYFRAPALCVAVFDDGGSSSTSPGNRASDGATDTRTPGGRRQTIQLFPAFQSGPSQIAVGKLSFTGPRIDTIRLGIEGRKEGWIELHTRNRDTPATDPGNIYIAPARLSALGREACEVINGAPDDDRNRLAEAVQKTDNPNGVWNFEYDSLRKTNIGVEKIVDKLSERKDGACP